MHTTYDNLTDQEFIRAVERDLTLPENFREAIVNRLNARASAAEYQRGYRHGLESAGARRANWNKL